MGADEPLLAVRRGQVWDVQLNRPHVLNALNHDVLARLAAAVQTFDADPALRLLLLSGSDCGACYCGRRPQGIRGGLALPGLRLVAVRRGRALVVLKPLGKRPKPRDRPHRRALPGRRLRTRASVRYTRRHAYLRLRPARAAGRTLPEFSSISSRA